MKHSEAQIGLAVKLLEDHTYKEVYAMTGIKERTLRAYKAKYGGLC